jgi:phosphoribosyl-ATP pyrophosphohydrolase
MVSDAKPVVICNPDGCPVDCARMNDKAFRKSLENGALWIVHPSSGKVLPYAEPAENATQGCTVVAEDGWYRAVLAQDVPHNGTGTTSSPVQTTAGHTASSHTAFPQEADLEVVTRLIQVIRKRKETMPEGSYTTYLFHHGVSKIRKKTGEEAVELILAETPEEAAGEAADLLYHLLVLLESLEIPLQDVLSILEERA